MTKNEFDTHVVFKTLKDLNETFQMVESSLDFIQGNFVNSYRSIIFKRGINFISKTLDCCIFEIIGNEILIGISKQLESVNLQLKTYHNSLALNNINNAESGLKLAISQSTMLPLDFDRIEFNHSNSISKLEQLFLDSSLKIESFNKKSNEDSEQLEILIENQKKQISSINEIISKSKTDLELIQDSFEKRFRSLQELNNDSFNEDRNKYTQSFKTLFDKSETEVLGYLEKLKIKETEASNLLNVIGNIGVTGNYQKVANAHQYSANLFRYISFGIMIVLSILLICAIWDIKSESFDWHRAIIRILVSTIFIYPAAYAAKESAKHRKLENYNRKAELELASINPFIELLSDQKKQEIKEKLVDKFFGNSRDLIEDHSINKSEEISPNMLEQIVKLINSIKTSSGS